MVSKVCSAPVGLCGADIGAVQAAQVEKPTPAPLVDLVLVCQTRLADLQDIGATEYPTTRSIPDPISGGATASLEALTHM